MISPDEGKDRRDKLTEKTIVAGIQKMGFYRNVRNNDRRKTYGEKTKGVAGYAVDRHRSHCLKRVRSIDDLFGRALADLKFGSGLGDHIYRGGMVEGGGRMLGDEEDGLFLSFSTD